MIMIELLGCATTRLSHNYIIVGIYQHYSIHHILLNSGNIINMIPHYYTRFNIASVSLAYSGVFHFLFNFFFLPSGLLPPFPFHLPRPLTFQNPLPRH